MLLLLTRIQRRPLLLLVQLLLKQTPNFARTGEPTDYYY
jgi:hypothetical protein